MSSRSSPSLQSEFLYDLGVALQGPQYPLGICSLKRLLDVTWVAAQYAVLFSSTELHLHSCGGASGSSNPVWPAGHEVSVHVSPRKLVLDLCWARLMRLFCRRPLQIIVVTPVFANKASTNINNFCPDRSGCTNVKCPQKRARHGWSPDVFGMSSSFEGAARCTLISGLRRLCSWLLF